MTPLHLVECLGKTLFSVIVAEWSVDSRLSVFQQSLGNGSGDLEDSRKEEEGAPAEEGLEDTTCQDGVEESTKSGPQLEEPRLEEPTLKEPKLGESRLEEPKLGEPRLEESRLEEPKLGESKLEEPRLEEPRLEEPRLEEPRLEEPRLEERSQGEPQLEEPRLECNLDSEPSLPQPQEANAATEEPSSELTPLSIPQESSEWTNPQVGARTSSDSCSGACGDTGSSPTLLNQRDTAADDKCTFAEEELHSAFEESGLELGSVEALMKSLEDQILDTPSLAECVDETVKQSLDAIEKEQIGESLSEGPKLAGGARSEGESTAALPGDSLPKQDELGPDVGDCRDDTLGSILSNSRTPEVQPKELEQTKAEKEEGTIPEEVAKDVPVEDESSLMTENEVSQEDSKVILQQDKEDLLADEGLSLESVSETSFTLNDNTEDAKDANDIDMEDVSLKDSVAEDTLVGKVGNDFLAELEDISSEDNEDFFDDMDSVSFGSNKDSVVGKEAVTVNSKPAHEVVSMDCNEDSVATTEAVTQDPSAERESCSSNEVGETSAETALVSASNEGSKAQDQASSSKDSGSEKVTAEVETVSDESEDTLAGIEALSNDDLLTEVPTSDSLGKDALSQDSLPEVSPAISESNNDFLAEKETCKLESSEVQTEEMPRSTAQEEDSSAEEQSDSSDKAVSVTIAGTDLSGEDVKEAEVQDGERQVEKEQALGVSSDDADGSELMASPIADRSDSKDASTEGPSQIESCQEDIAGPILVEAEAPEELTVDGGESSEASNVEEKAQTQSEEISAGPVSEVEESLAVLPSEEILVSLPEEKSESLPEGERSAKKEESSPLQMPLQEESAPSSEDASVPAAEANKSSVPSPLKEVDLAPEMEENSTLTTVREEAAPTPMEDVSSAEILDSSAVSPSEVKESLANLSLEAGGLAEPSVEDRLANEPMDSGESSTEPLIEESIAEPPVEIDGSLVEPPVEESLSKALVDKEESSSEPLVEAKESLDKPVEADESSGEPPVEEEDSVSKPLFRAGESSSEPSAEEGESVVEPPVPAEEIAAEPPVAAEDSLAETPVEGEDVVQPHEEDESSPAKPSMEVESFATEPSSGAGDSLSKPPAEEDERLSKLPVDAEGSSVREEDSQAKPTTDAEKSSAEHLAESEEISAEPPAEEGESRTALTSDGDRVESLPMEEEDIPVAVRVQEDSSPSEGGGSSEATGATTEATPEDISPADDTPVPSEGAEIQTEGPEKHVNEIPSEETAVEAAPVETRAAKIQHVAPLKASSMDVAKAISLKKELLTAEEEADIPLESLKQEELDIPSEPLDEDDVDEALDDDSACFKMEESTDRDFDDTGLVIDEGEDPPLPEDPALIKSEAIKVSLGSEVSIKLVPAKSSSDLREKSKQTQSVTITPKDHLLKTPEYLLRRAKAQSLVKMAEPTPGKARTKVSKAPMPDLTPLQSDLAKATSGRPAKTGSVPKKADLNPTVKSLLKGPSAAGPAAGPSGNWPQPQKGKARSGDNFRPFPSLPKDTVVIPTYYVAEQEKAQQPMNLSASNDLPLMCKSIPATQPLPANVVPSQQKKAPSSSAAPRAPPTKIPMAGPPPLPMQSLMPKMDNNMFPAMWSLFGPQLLSSQFLAAAAGVGAPLPPFPLDPQKQNLLEAMFASSAMPRLPIPQEMNVYNSALMQMQAQMDALMQPKVPDMQNAPLPPDMSRYNAALMQMQAQMDAFLPMPPGGPGMLLGALPPGVPAVPPPNVPPFAKAKATPQAKAPPKPQATILPQPKVPPKPAAQQSILAQSSVDSKTAQPAVPRKPGNLIFK